MNNSCTQANTLTFSTTEEDLEKEKQFAALSKALAHPARIRILKYLLTLEKMGTCLNSELVSELGLAQSTVSEHLRILKQAEFITAEPIPPKVCYRPNRDRIDAFSALFAEILSNTEHEVAVI